MDELTREYVADSVGTFTGWDTWPPELFINVYKVIPSCRIKCKKS